MELVVNISLISRVGENETTCRIDEECVRETDEDGGRIEGRVFFCFIFGVAFLVEDFAEPVAVFFLMPE